MSNHCFNLENRDLMFVRSTRSFVYLLRLAHVFGWKPKGTKLDPEERSLEEVSQWDGNYFLNEAQIVEEDDAMAIAQALEKAVTFFREARNLNMQATSHMYYSEYIAVKPEQQKQQHINVDDIKIEGEDELLQENPEVEGNLNTFKNAVGAIFGFMYSKLEDYDVADVIAFFDYYPDSDYDYNEVLESIEELITFCKAGAFRIC